MSKLARIAIAMSRRGYQSTPHRMDTKASACFKLVNGSWIDHVAYFRYLPGRKGYDVSIGVNSPMVRSLLSPALVECAKPLDPINHPISELMDPMFYPSISLFPVGEYLGWQDGIIPADNDNQLNFSLDHLQTKIQAPIFQSIRTLEDLLSVLLREDAPFLWARSLILSRIAQIAFAVSFFPAYEEAAVEVVHRNFKYLKSDTYGGKSGENIFEMLLNYFRMNKLPFIDPRSVGLS